MLLALTNMICKIMVDGKNQYIYIYITNHIHNFSYAKILSEIAINKVS